VYIVMEHCANGNLHEHLVANGAVTQEQARLWIGQVSFYLFCPDSRLPVRSTRSLYT
jgi:hypothetical protein